MRSSDSDVIRNLIFRSLQKETRLSESQVARLRWSQIKGDTITTAYHRKIIISRELVDALTLLPRRKSGVDLVFFGTASLSASDIHSSATFARSDNPEPRGKLAIFAHKVHKHIDNRALAC